MRALALVLVALLAAPAAALAQATPFQGLPPAQTTPTVVVAPPAPGESDGLSGWQEALLYGAGAVLLVGIGWMIVRDARRRRPSGPGRPRTPGMGGSKPNRSPQAKRRARQKAKQARRQRRRNR